jgi:hypothetical protein
MREEQAAMMLGVLQAALALARLRWEHRAVEWGLRVLDDRQRRDIGLPPHREAHPRAWRADWC